MPSPLPHPMMPRSNHDELAEQKFVLALKGYFWKELDPPMRAATADAVADLQQDGSEPRFADVRRRLEKTTAYQNWVSGMRTGQELMWQTAGDCVDRQQEDLEQRAEQAPQLGSLRLDPNFTQPAYLDAADTHMMPGGYGTNQTDTDLRQGAVYDKGAALYAMGRQGGALSDLRGHTVVSHVMERFPDLKPQRILDIGCTTGASTVAVASYYPEADFQAVDVGASILRYAHARAAHMGAAVHFSQQNAEDMDFEDNSFDLIYSCAVLHETSNKAAKHIFAECYRLLKPGGVMVHVEVPVRVEQMDMVGQVRGHYEARYNNEPFWAGVAQTDFAGLAKTVGLTEVEADYQDGVTKANPNGPPGFKQANKGAYLSWYVISGVKADG
jgi:SAM-dependent methyltransferase